MVVDLYMPVLFLRQVIHRNNNLKVATNCFNGARDEIFMSMLLAGAIGVVLNNFFSGHGRGWLSLSQDSISIGQIVSPLSSL